MGVTGSIAAYKAAELANRLTKDGYSVHTILTSAGAKFIMPLTFQALTKNKVYTDMFEPYVPYEIEHISLAQKADLFVVAPASTDFIAKAAAGIADDMLTTVLLAAPNIPRLIAPAMNTAMYENPITQRNIRTLSEFGFIFIDPREARLACGDLGKGALADVDVILSEIKKNLGKTNGLQNAMKGGVGAAAFRQGDLIVAAVFAVNCVGDIVENGRIIAGARRPEGGFADSEEMILSSYGNEKDFFSGNTVIGCIMTNAALSRAQACRVSGRGQDAIAKMIHPAHSVYDGDTVFTLASGKVNTSMDAVGILAEHSAAEAILDAVKSAEGYKNYAAFNDLQYDLQ